MPKKQEMCPTLSSIMGDLSTSLATMQVIEQSVKIGKLEPRMISLGRNTLAHVTKLFEIEEKYCHSNTPFKRSEIKHLAEEEIEDVERDMRAHACAIAKHFPAVEDQYTFLADALAASGNAKDARYVRSVEDHMVKSQDVVKEFSDMFCTNE